MAATIASTFYRDGNRVPITTDGIITKRTVTFTGGTADTWGDHDGALDGTAIYTVTGLVFCKLISVIKTSLDGVGATIEAGITGATTLFMPQETATDMDAGQIWLNDAGNTTYGIIGAEGAAAGNLPEYALNGNDIILTVGTANITSGAIDFYLIWRPISDDASVEVTTT
jgi:hypothetical protein